MGQKGHQILLALLALPGGVLPLLHLTLERVQIFLERREFPWAGRTGASCSSTTRRSAQANLLQPAGKAPHGQVERRQHQHQHARRQKRLLVAANGLPVELQGLILALAEQRTGRPDKKAGKGVLKHAVHHHLQQEQARQPGDEGARHYEQEHFQF